MKTYAAVLFAVSSGLALSVPAVAEPFNDRGEEYIASVRPGTQASESRVAEVPVVFNERGEDYIVTAPVGSDMPHQMVAASFGGFNDRSFSYDKFGTGGDDYRRVVAGR